MDLVTLSKNFISASVRGFVAAPSSGDSSLLLPPLGTLAIIDGDDFDDSEFSDGVDRALLSCTFASCMFASCTESQLPHVFLRRMATGEGDVDRDVDRGLGGLNSDGCSSKCCCWCCAGLDILAISASSTSSTIANHGDKNGDDGDVVVFIDDQSELAAVDNEGGCCCRIRIEEADDLLLFLGY